MHAMYGILIAGMLGQVNEPAVRERTNVCRAADKESAISVGWLTSIATGSDSASAAWRATLKVPATQANKIALITDEAVCVLAANAYQAAVQTQSSGRQVYVIQVATVYVVEDPNEFAGEWKRIIIFDKNFALLSSFTK